MDEGIDADHQWHKVSDPVQILLTIMEAVRFDHHYNNTSLTGCPLPLPASIQCRHQSSRAQYGIKGAHLHPRYNAQEPTKRTYRRMETSQYDNFPLSRDWTLE